MGVIEHVLARHMYMVVVYRRSIRVVINHTEFVRDFARTSVELISHGFNTRLERSNVFTVNRLDYIRTAMIVDCQPLQGHDYFAALDSRKEGFRFGQPTYTQLRHRYQPFAGLVYPICYR